MPDPRNKPTLNGTVIPVMGERYRITLGHLIRGDSEQRIANSLGISQKQLYRYMKHVFHVFGARSRGDLVQTCLSIMQVRQKKNQLK